MKYGFYFKVTKTSFYLMINGRMFSVYKGCNTGKLTISIWDNYWRKNKIKNRAIY